MDLDKILELRERLQQIYSELPDIQCKGLCYDQCSVIPMEPAERKVLKALGGLMPRDLSEISFAEEQILKLSRGAIAPKCAALGSDNRCKIYADRPIICRLYGLVRGGKNRMLCPHGCKPSRWLNDKEAYDLISMVESLDAR